jgi:hypothetical protein
MKTKTSWKTIVCLSALWVLASGCPGDEPPAQTDTGQTTDVGPDGGHDEVGVDDAGDDVGDDPDADGGPACEPIMECPMDACGAIDDGEDARGARVTLGASGLPPVGDEVHGEEVARGERVDEHAADVGDRGVGERGVLAKLRVHRLFSSWCGG